MRVVISLILVASFPGVLAMGSNFPASISEGLFILALAAETQKYYPIEQTTPTQENPYGCRWNGCHYSYDVTSRCIKHTHTKRTSKKSQTLANTPNHSPKKLKEKPR
jgi:hypothetical protein